MQSIIANHIRCENPTQEMLDWCKEHLILDNPDFQKKERMGLWTGNTPRQIYLYEKRGSDLILPFGCVRELHEQFPNMPLYSSICPSKTFYCKSDINLYPYQEKAVKSALKAKNGVLVMPCGSGKTQTALEIIATLGLKTLWLTHTQDLLNQSMTRAKSVLTCDYKSYGTITGGKVNIGSGITFATVQTMSKLDLSQYKNEWGCIVVDECHKAVGSPTKVMQFYKVLSNLSCRYKFGLTATPKRADGLERSMFALIGGIICEIPKDEVKDTTCPVFVETVETGYMPDLDIALSADGTINYSGLVDDLTHNEKRFYDVTLKVNQVSQIGATLVLANRVEYLTRMSDVLEKAGCNCLCLSAMGNSKAAKAHRKEALKKLNDGDLDCVLATYQLAAEGLDCPNLRYVVFATPEKNNRTVEQASGRVARKYNEKEHGIVIDFIDDFGMYRGWAKKRRAVYKRLGYEYV